MYKRGHIDNHSGVLGCFFFLPPNRADWKEVRGDLSAVTSQQVGVSNDSPQVPFCL